jgi:hypothetical protein
LHAFERDYQKGRTASDIEVTITISDEAWAPPAAVLRHLRHALT